MTVVKNTEGSESGVTISSDAALKKLGTLKVRLESGQDVWLNIADELKIPTGVDTLMEAARHGCERYAFWAYQAEIQASRIRALERKLEIVEAQGDVTMRKYIHNECEWDVTEKGVAALKDAQPDIGNARVALNRARKEYGRLRVIAKAMDHRCFALDRLVARLAEVHKG